MRIGIARGIPAALLLAAITGCGSSDDAVDPIDAVADSLAVIDAELLAGMPEGTTTELMSMGRTAFVVCTVCHGVDAEGTQLGPSLRDTAWIHIPADIDSIARLVRTGVERPKEFPIPMPVMGGGDFDEAELKAVASYVYALSRRPL